MTSNELEDHAGQGRTADRGPSPAGTGHGDLVGQAQRLGQQHHAAGIAPSGDAGYVFRDAGSARLLDALGVISPTTDDNAPRRFRVVDAYCNALDALDIEPGS